MDALHGSEPRRATVVRQVAFEDLGLLEPLLRKRGYRVDQRDAGVDEIAGGDADLLIVLGGPIGVGDADRYPFLHDEVVRIREALEAGTAVLGICLGAQLVAAACGARVLPAARKEIGWGPLSLTEAGRRSVLAPLEGRPVLHWHGDRFEVPDGAERLASTPGFPDQAFALGQRVLGLQFHLEADPRTFERWLIGHAQELADEGIDPRDLRRQAAEHGSRLAQRGVQVLDSWLHGLETEEARTPRGVRA